ncbi:MAG: hypothetical protein JJ975_09860 [Bacteroidia bacterium]|nr:hypothetical protein [Bacteroidia bacterium]
MSFRKALQNAQTAKRLVLALGIDWTNDLVGVGYNSGKFHRKKGKSIDVAARAIYEEMNLLGRLDADGRYRHIWAKGCITFPLRDQEGNVINFFSLSQEALDEGSYLNDQGLYPYYPDQGTKLLSLEYNIVQTAKHLSSNPTDRSTISLNKGVLINEHFMLIAELSNLSTIQLPLDLMDDKELKRLEQFIQEKQLSITIEQLSPVSSSKERKLPLAMNLAEPFNQNEQEHLEQSPISIDLVGGMENVHMNQFNRLEVTLRIRHKQMPSRIYRNSVDLYHFQSVTELVQEASQYIGADEDELQTALDDVILQIEESMASKQKQKDWETDSLNQQGKSHGLTEKGYQKAKELARSPELLETLYTGLLNNIGIVNEKDNRMICFLVSISRKLSRPLHLINVGSTGTGKSFLLETIGRTLPPEELLELTSISEKALFNINGSLTSKVIMIQDMFDVSDEVSYQLRELQSKGKLTRSVTQKLKDGTFTTIYQETLGPVSIMASTTDDKQIYADNSNRNIILSQDESDEQDKAILDRQKKLASRSIDTTKENQTIKQLQDLQRIIKPYRVKNIYANDLELPPFVERKRRTMSIYLGLIEALTLLNQYQRKIEIIDGVEYLITDVNDIKWANRLIEPILLYKSDLLGNASRQFFENLKTWSQEQKIETFSSKEIALGLRAKANTIKSHIRQLRDYGMLQVVSGDRYKQGFTYRIAQRTEYDQLKKHVEKTLQTTLTRISTKYGKVA